MDKKVYTKQELAMLYFPDSTPRVANAHLRRWIQLNKQLSKLLYASGYVDSSKYFTTKQVEIILDFLGDP